MPNQATDTRSEIRERILRNRRRTRLYTVSRILFILFFLVFTVSAVLTAYQLYRDRKDAEFYDELSHMVTEPSVTETIAQPEGTTDPAASDPDATEGTTEPAEPAILAKYQNVYSMNNDLYGWLSIDGTSFNYPVVHTPEDEEYYLRRGFNGKASRGGVPFMDADCETGCGNYLIYGHNMNNGTMFAQLLAYDREEFWKEHPVISFDTLYEEGDYEVISAFYSRVFYQYETNVFRFYNYHDLTDPEVYQEYVDQVKAASIYDTGIDASYGEDLITLITCSYGRRHERFVVVAKKQP